MLSALLNIEPEVVEQLLREQFQGKEKLIPPNMQAFEIGRAAALERFACPLPMHAQRRDAVGDRILMDGNSAAGLGCVYAGATVAAWYPITPSTSLVDAFSAYCEDYRVNPDGSKRYAILQAEDELAAIGMVVGAAWNGARSFTATSGPGISLMTEFLGLAYYAEIPVVLFDIQRCGPSTGMPTRTQQSDLLSSAYASHGDTKHVLLFPASPKECFDMAAQAFDLAERLQTPVLVMSDLDLGMNDWLSEPLDLGRRLPAGPRQGADAPSSWRTASSSIATSTSTATPSPTAPCPARTRARAPSSPAARGTIAWAPTPKTAPSIRTTSTACGASSTPPPRWCRMPSSCAMAATAPASSTSAPPPR